MHFCRCSAAHLRKCWRRKDFGGLQAVEGPLVVEVGVDAGGAVAVASGVEEGIRAGEPVVAVGDSEAGEVGAAGVALAGRGPCVGHYRSSS
jgi:hypothetical protein